MPKINARILGLFIFIIFSWGLGWPANKLGLAYSTPAWYTAIRLMAGTITMFAFVIAVKKCSLPKRRDLPLIFVIGILQIALYIYLANIGLTYLPAGRSSLLAYTTPLWVMLATVFIFHEENTPIHWIGFILGLLGLFILLSPWELNWRDHNVLFGAAMLLLASLSWAISMLCARYMHWTKSPLELIPWQLLLGTIPMVIYAYFQEPAMQITWSAPLLISLIYTGVIVTGLSYWSGVVINKELPTLVVSLGFLLVPVFSLTVSALFMHEPITLLMITAMAFIIGGLVCVIL